MRYYVLLPSISSLQLAILIRNKFPSRRKALREGFSTIYYFQDLVLMNREGLGTSEVSATPPTLIRTEINGQPVKVYNPPADRIFMVGEFPYVALRMTTYPEPAPGVSYEVLSLPEMFQAKAEDTANVQSRFPSPAQPKVTQDSTLEEHQDDMRGIKQEEITIKEEPIECMNDTYISQEEAIDVKEELTPPSLPEEICEDMNITEYMNGEILTPPSLPGDKCEDMDITEYLNGEIYK